MFVVIYSPRTNETMFSEKLSDDVVMDAEVFAKAFAAQYDCDLAESTGYIPSCCGDFRVEFREDPENSLVIWSGQSFYFA